MKIDILFKLLCLCVFIGSIKAANDTENDTGIATSVPSAATSSPVELNENDNTTTITTTTDPPTETTASNQTSETSPTVATSLSTNATDEPAPNVTDSGSSTTDSSETTQTPHLSTGEVGPTAAPSKGGTPGGFNALSFIGGIVFTVGLLAIMYVGFKFYKSRTERNYHTL